MIENPYATPSDLSMPPPLESSLEHAESVRKAHLNREANIKSLGSLYILGAIFFAVGGSCLLFSNNEAEKIGAIVILILSPLQFYLGLAIRKLKPWSRIFIGIESGLGLLAFPIGTLFNAIILGIVFTQKGSVVFSSEYKEIIALTPHIKRKTSIIVWIALGFALLVILGCAAAMLVGTFAKK